jgi:Flp pilus assembly protein TadD
MLALRLDQMYRAIEHLQRAVELRLEPNWLFKLARTYEKAGFLRKARRTWEQASTLVSDQAIQQRIQRHLRQLDS